jgi:hypothetical protein
MLFTELALIRFTSAYIVYLKYFTNFVLLASFLGIGVGFLRAGARHDRSALAPFALLAVVVFVMIFPVRQTPGQSGPILRGLFGTPPLPVWVSLPLLFLAVTAAMACIGEGVARVFVRFDALQAYRLDILGSLLGIAAFTLGSFLHAGPIVWGLVIAAALAVTSEWPIGTVRVLALGAFVLLLVGTSVLSGDLWSPYYRIGVGRDAGSRIPITVNGLPHQSILPFRELVRRQPFYLYPYEHLRSRPRRVLIVGAGSGNDVAVALREGAGSVDAVEIDPLLQRLGRARHPDHPYAGADRRPVRPDRVRLARLPDPRVGCGVAPAGELSVHTRGLPNGPGPPGRRWRLQHVQLLPARRLRPVRGHPERGLRTRPVPGPRAPRRGTEAASGPDDRGASELDRLHHPVAAHRAGARACHR